MCSVQLIPSVKVNINFVHCMKNLLIALFLLNLGWASAQNPENNALSKDTAVGSVLFRVAYAAQVPVGDYADRFGFTNHIGASVGFRTKSNWIFSLGGYYIFGVGVAGKDSLLAGMTNSSNLIIGSGGEQAFIDVSQQGYTINFQVGKVFPWAAPNKNSGFMFTVGGGFMEHQIRYKAQGNNVPQLLGDYRKGYDRLTNGIFIQEFIGYHFQGTTRLLNFYGGFEFTQGFTGNRRSYDIPTMGVKNESYQDFLFGFKIGWMMPFYQRSKEKYYYYD
mgnify:CR=1 FL=1